MQFPTRGETQTIPHLAKSFKQADKLLKREGPMGGREQSVAFGLAPRWTEGRGFPSQDQAGLES